MHIENLLSRRRHFVFEVRLGDRLIGHACVLEDPDHGFGYLVSEALDPTVKYLRALGEQVAADLLRTMVYLWGVRSDDPEREGAYTRFEELARECPPFSVSWKDRNSAGLMKFLDACIDMSGCDKPKFEGTLHCKDHQK